MNLANSLNNLGNRQSELGKREEALASTEEAVVIYQRLFARVPAAFARSFMVTLRNYLERLAALGRSPEDDPVFRSAVKALQRAQLDPA